MVAVEGDESIGGWHVFVVVWIFVAVVSVASVTVTVVVVIQKLKDTRANPQITMTVVEGKHVTASHGAMIARLKDSETGREVVGQRLLNAC